MDYSNQLPLQRLIDSGLLFYINLCVLHPLGYALCVTVGDEKEPQSLTVIDATEDREGVLYQTIDDSMMAKLRSIKSFIAKRHADREAVLGFVVQPTEPESVEQSQGL